MNTRHKGNVAVAHAIAHFSSLGYSVFLPIGDAGGAIDLVVSPDGEKILRVQCKYTAHKHHAYSLRYPDSPIWTVHMMRPTAKGEKHKATYTTASFDLIFVATPDGNYLIDWKEHCASTGKAQAPNQLLIGKRMAQWKL